MTDSSRVQNLVNQFRQRFGKDPQTVVRAPGRVSLLGGHVDFMDGFVMPAAIDRDVMIAVSTAEGAAAELWSCNFGRFSKVDLPSIEFSDDEPWSNFPRGVLDQMQKAGFSVPGLQMAVEGNVPLGGGLSSSAAFEVATAAAVLAISGQSMDGRDLARLCQRAENRFIGVNSGIMDQVISVFGKAGHVMFLDCRTLEFQLAPLPPDTSIIVCDSKRTRSLDSSAYNARRAQCDEAVKLFQQWIPGVRALRDVSPEQFEEYRDRLPAEVEMRARHVVYEIARCEQAFAALNAGDFNAFGDLMNASHASSRDSYRSSIPELDWLQEAAASVTGCLGSRLTGAGFGGCTVSLVSDSAIDRFRASVTEAFEKKAGYPPDVLVMRASDGAGVII